MFVCGVLFLHIHPSLGAAFPASTADAFTPNAPADPGLALVQGIGLSKQGEYADCAAIAGRVQAGATTGSDLELSAKMLASLAWFRQGKLTDAIAIWKEALATNRPSPIAAYAGISLGIEQLLLGEFNGAEKALREAVMADPPEGIGHANLVFQALPLLKQKAGNNTEGLRAADLVGDQAAAEIRTLFNAEVAPAATDNHADERFAEILKMARDQSGAAVLTLDQSAPARTAELYLQAIRLRPQSREDSRICLAFAESLLDSSTATPTVENAAAVLRYAMGKWPARTSAGLRARALFGKCLRLVGNEVAYCIFAEALVGDFHDFLSADPQLSADERAELEKGCAQALFYLERYCVRHALSAYPLPQRIMARLAELDWGLPLNAEIAEYFRRTAQPVLGSCQWGKVEEKILELITTGCSVDSTGD